MIIVREREREKRELVLVDRERVIRADLGDAIMYAIKSLSRLLIFQHQQQQQQQAERSQVRLICVLVICGVLRIIWGLEGVAVLAW